MESQAGCDRSVNNTSQRLGRNEGHMAPQKSSVQVWEVVFPPLSGEGGQCSDCKVFMWQDFYSLIQDLRKNTFFSWFFLLFWNDFPFGIYSDTGRCSTVSVILQLLTFSLICWFGNLSLGNKNSIGSVVNQCRKSISVNLKGELLSFSGFFRLVNIF